MKRFGFTIAILLCATAAWAQGEGPKVPSELAEYVAILLNVGLIGVVVQFAKRKIAPWLKAKVSWFIPLFSIVSGSLAVMLTNAVFQQFGVDVDFSAIFGAIIGSGTSNVFPILNALAGGKLSAQAKAA